MCDIMISDCQCLKVLEYIYTLSKKTSFTDAKFLLSTRQVIEIRE